MIDKISGVLRRRTSDDASLNVEQVCDTLKNRDGYTGNYDDLVEYVKRHFDEAINKGGWR